MLTEVAAAGEEGAGGAIGIGAAPTLGLGGGAGGNGNAIGVRCGRRFSRVDNMKDHMRRIHRKGQQEQAGQQPDVSATEAAEARETLLQHEGGGKRTAMLPGSSVE